MEVAGVVCRVTGRRSKISALYIIYQEARSVEEDCLRQFVPSVFFKGNNVKLFNFQHDSINSKSRCHFGNMFYYQRIIKRKSLDDIVGAADVRTV